MLFLLHGTVTAASFTLFTSLSARNSKNSSNGRRPSPPCELLALLHLEERTFPRILLLFVCSCFVIIFFCFFEFAISIFCSFSVNLKDLQKTLCAGSKPFFWTAVLLGLMNYIVAIYLTQIVLVYRVESNVGASLEPYFGSVPVQGARAQEQIEQIKEIEKTPQFI